MRINKVIVGPLNTNCYILENDNKCLIIDPGDNFEIIKRNVIKEVVAVLLTHSHFDHCGAVKDCVDFYKVPLISFDNMKEYKFGIDTFSFNIKHNPGHTMDSISFIFDDIMFCGDFIFKACIGRCDLGGDNNIMKESIETLLDSNIDYILYPGHGEATILSNERKMLENII